MKGVDVYSVATLMNRTLTYASVGTRGALRSRSGVPVCWSCSLAQNCRQPLQNHIQSRATALLIPTLARYGSTYKEKKRKSLKVNQANPAFPVLEGEIHHTREEIRSEKLKKLHQSRLETEQERLKLIDKKRVEQLPANTSTKKKASVSIPSEKLPSPKQAGIYISSTFSH